MRLKSSFYLSQWIYSEDPNYISDKIKSLLDSIRACEDQIKEGRATSDTPQKLVGIKKMVEKYKRRYKNLTGNDWTESSHQKSSNHSWSDAWNKAWQDAEEDLRRRRDQRRAAAKAAKDAAKKDYDDAYDKYKKHFRKSAIIGGATGAGIGGTIGYAIGRKRMKTTKNPNSKWKWALGGALVGGAAGTGAGMVYSTHKHRNNLTDKMNAYNRAKYNDYYAAELTDTDLEHLTKMRAYHKARRNNKIGMIGVGGELLGAGIGLGIGHGLGMHKAYQKAGKNMKDDEILINSELNNKRRNYESGGMLAGMTVGALGGLYLGHKVVKKSDSEIAAYRKKYIAMTPAQRAKSRAALRNKLRNF